MERTAQSQNLSSHDDKFIDNRYEIIRFLGSGGMGKAYLVRDLSRGELLALKILTQKSCTPTYIQLLKKEFILLKGLRHSNLVEVHNFGITEEGIPYFTMEYVEGVDICEFSRENGSEEPFLNDCLTQILSALDYIHAHGVVHGDIKPSNILLTPEDTIKLMDFGLAGSSGVSKESGGTLEYMAPERLLHNRCDQRSDLYAAGLVIFEIIHKKIPETFRMIGKLKTSKQVKEEFVPEFPSVYSPGFQKVITKLLKPNPADRYQWAGEALSELEKSDKKNTNKSSCTHQFQVFPGMTGRDKEFQKLKNGFKAAQNGKGNICVIAGERGIGKTRLLEELKIELQVEGKDVFHKNCYEQESRPFQPFVGIIREIIPTLKHLKPAILMEHIPPLLKFLPETAQDPFFAKLKSPPLLSSEQERLRLFHHVTSLLVECALLDAISIFIEDIQWGDNLTLDYLEYLSRNVSENKIFMCVSYTDMGTTENIHAQNFAERMYTSHPDSRVHLTRLTRNQLRSFLVSALGEIRNSRPLEEKIFKASGGNPYLAQEIVRAYIIHGVLNRSSGKWILKESLLQTVAPPTEIRDALLIQLRQADTSLLKLLQLASVIGKEFDMETISSVLEMNSRETLRLLRSAEQNDYIKPTDTGGYRIQQEILSSTIYGTLATDEKGELRKKLIHYMEKTLKEGEEDLASDLSYQCHEAKMFEKCLHYSRVAGDRFLQIHTLDEALVCFKRGVDALRQLPDCSSNMRTMLQLYYDMGNIYRKLGDLDKGQKCYSFVYDRTGDTDMGQMHANSLMNIGYLKSGKGEFPAALKCYDSSLKLYREQGDKRGCAEIGKLKGNVFLTCGNFRDGSREYRKALKICEEIDDQRMRADLLNNLGVIYDIKGNYKMVQKTFQKSMKIWESLNDQEGTARSLNNLGVISDRIGNYLEAINWMKKSLKISQTIHDQYMIALCKTNLGDNHSYIGNFKIAERFHMEALALARQMGDKILIGDNILALGIDYYETGKYLKACRYLTNAVQLSQEIKNSDQEFKAHLGLGNMYLRLAAFTKLEKTIQSLQNAKPEKERSQRECIQYIYLKARLEQYYYKNTRKAKLLYNKGLRIAKKINNKDEETRMHLASADLNKELGNSREQWEHLCLARRKVRSIQNKILKAEIWLQTGIHQIARGNRSAGLSHLRKSLKTAEKTGSLELLFKVHSYQGFSYKNTTTPHAIKHLEIALTILDTLAGELPDDVTVHKYLSHYTRKKFFENLFNLGNWTTINPVLMGMNHLRLINQNGFCENSFTSGALPVSHEVDQLNTLLEISRKLNSSLDIQTLLVRILDESVNLSRTQRGFLLLISDNSNFSVTIGRNNRKEFIPDQEMKHISQSVINHVLSTRRPILTVDAQKDAQFKKRQSILELDLRTIMCVPLIIDNDLLGMIYVDSQKVSSSRLGEKELELLNALASHAAIAIKNANTHRKSEQLIQELESANQRINNIYDQLIHSEKLSTIGQLSSSVAHDINNLLVAITTYSDLMLMETKNDDPKWKGLNIIKSQAEKIARLSGTLLNFSRKKKQEMKPTCLKTIIDDIEIVVKNKFVKSNIQFERDISTDLPLFLSIPGQMEQVFLNLIINAIHAMEQGGTLCINADLLHTQDGQSQIHVMISDTGKGIPEAIQDKIFESFFTTKGENGSGLGLAICKNIIEEHNGEIRFDSKPEIGTTFHVYLPLK